MSNNDDKDRWETFCKLYDKLSSKEEMRELFEEEIKCFSLYLSHVNQDYVYNATFLPQFNDDFWNFLCAFNKKYKIVELIMFEDRIEIHNPGGLYGRITIDQLGKIQPDTRNLVLASALETLGITENRYSGIPTIRMEMEKYNLRQPEFLDERGSFIVKLYKESKNDYEDMSNDEETNNLIVFCKTPRTRKEICDYLGLNSVTYAIQTYVNPLVEAGVIKLSIPDKPKSPKQLYYSVEREE